MSDRLIDFSSVAERSGDRIETPALSQLAAEAIRLARVATSIHLAARVHPDADHGTESNFVTRESTG
ncbi:MAG: hypothetical protein AAF432_07010 [Planctomycetota bacterium]